MEVYPQIRSGLLLRSENRAHGCKGSRPGQLPEASGCSLPGNIYQTGLATFFRPEGISR